MNEELEGVIADSFDRLRGRFLGLIESWGMPERQEAGAKNTFKSLTYDMQEDITETLDAIIEAIDSSQNPS